MKKGIHPENYRLVAFKDMSNEDVFLTKSTADAKETIEIARAAGADTFVAGSAVYKSDNPAAMINTLRALAEHAQPN